MLFRFVALIAATVPVEGETWYDVSFSVEGKGMVREAQVCRVKNGIAVNYGHLKAFLFA